MSDLVGTQIVGFLMHRLSFKVSLTFHLPKCFLRTCTDQSLSDSIWTSETARYSHQTAKGKKYISYPNLEKAEKVILLVRL